MRNPKTVAWKFLPVLLFLSVLMFTLPPAQTANTGFLNSLTETAKAVCNEPYLIYYYCSSGRAR